MPLGMAYIAAVLEKSGHTVRVLDMLIERLDEEAVLSHVRSFNPDVVGFSSVTTTVNTAYRLNTLIKREFPAIFTMLGGPHCSALPEEAVRNGVDVVVRGEG
ncbi:MAG: cobalamin-dependent protein, partial [Kiritimatiellaeota bacterium]|nr:cobalamin-dependent protein [Kiritimatiellota bacterium]